MHRLCALLFAAIVFIVWHAPARASGDFGCSASWKLVHTSYTGCDNMAMLQPGNDTRTNLILLMGDLRGHKSTPSPLPDLDASGTRREALSDWATFANTLYPPVSRNPDDSSDYADGEGSRCRSNAQGASDFAEAVRSAKRIAETERQALIAARQQLAPDCAGQSGGAEAVRTAASVAQSPAGKAFAAYLAGTLAFYDGNYDAATAGFSGLRSAPDPWVQETARYMLGRVEVNRAQVDAFDEYGTMNGPEHINQKAIDAGEAALLAYMHDYPNGRYFTSARGLLRRLYWLGGRSSKLAAEYGALMAMDPAARGLSDADLAEEIDNKLRPGLKVSDAHEPAILAMVDLLNMRRCTDGNDTPGDCGEPISRTDLDAQKPLFASNPRLFDFLLAAYAFHVLGRPDEVLAILPVEKANGGWSTLDFSRAMLRAMALEASGRGSDALWLDMLPSARLPLQRQAVELGLAMHQERSGKLAQIFLPQSEVKAPTMRERLLVYVAGPSLLRQQAKAQDVPRHERDAALYTLLYKELTRGAYRDFLADIALVPADAPAESNYWGLISPGETNSGVSSGIFTKSTSHGEYDCPPLQATVSKLAASPADAKARLCLADWALVNGFDGMLLDTPQPKDELGGTPSQFPGKPFSRLEIYKALIADPKTPAPDKAYALYRAVNCYAPTGSNSCGGVEVPLSVRKSWFNRLKKDYPSSTWAQELRYYW